MPFTLRPAFLAVALAALTLSPIPAGATDPPKLGGGGVGKGSDALRPDLYISAMGYSAGKITFSIRNQGLSQAGASKYRISCQLDPNQPSSCAVSFKPTENAGPVFVCPGFVSLNPEVGDIPALAAGQVVTKNLYKGLKAGCRYRINLQADSSGQVAESNEGNNATYYIAVGQ